MDDLVKEYDKYNKLEFRDIALERDNAIYLLKAIEVDSSNKRSYIRNVGIRVGTTVVTSNFCDTVHFMEELKLFDTGNSQNKYFEVVEYQKNKNLKLKLETDSNIFISKAQAKGIYKNYNLSFLGYSMARVLEYEFTFTPEILTKILFENKLLQR